MNLNISSPFLDFQLLVYKDFLKKALPEPLGEFRCYSKFSHKNCISSFQSNFLCDYFINAGLHL